MATGWRRHLAMTALVLVLLTGSAFVPHRSGATVAMAATQGLVPAYQPPLGLHRACGRKIRAAYRAPGCTRLCYPRNFYRQRMDYCVQTGGAI